MISAQPGGLVHVKPSARRTIRVAVRPHLAREEVRALGEQLVRRLSEGDVAEVQVDVSSVRRPDVAYIDALARIQLVARRQDSRVRLIGPCSRLLELLVLVGLEDTFRDEGDTSGLELHREPEHREQPLDVEVGVDPGDQIA
jgi:ABC-type transporter Mla MlaB component